MCVCENKERMVKVCLLVSCCVCQDRDEEREAYGSRKGCELRGAYEC